MKETVRKLPSRLEEVREKRDKSESVAQSWSQDHSRATEELDSDHGKKE